MKNHAIIAAVSQGQVQYFSYYPWLVGTQLFMLDTDRTRPGAQRTLQSPLVEVSCLLTAQVVGTTTVCL